MLNITLVLYMLKAKEQRKDFTEAMKWYNKAAELGDCDSMFMIGVMYANGQGVSTNLNSAKSWWDKAVEYEHPKAMFFSGQMYESGDGGTPVDRARAAELYLKACNAGDIREAGKRAIALRVELEKLAENGSASAQFSLGVMNKYYLEQAGTGARYLQMAADQNHPEALRVLGTLYETGDGVIVDERKAGEFYLRAAELGDKIGMFNMGVCMQDGTGGFTKDIDEAIRWFRRAAENNFLQANKPLATLLAQRNRNRADANEAVQRMTLFASAHPGQTFGIAAGDNSWWVTMALLDDGMSVLMEGITLDELEGLPED